MVARKSYFISLSFEIFWLFVYLLQRVVGMLRLIITSGLSLCQNRQLTSSKALNVKNKVFLLHVEPRVTHRGSRESSDHGGIAVEHLWNLGGFSLGGNCLVLFMLGLQPPTCTQASFALSFDILDTAHELYRTKRCKGREASSCHLKRLPAQSEGKRGYHVLQSACL